MADVCILLFLTGCTYCNNSENTRLGANLSKTFVHSTVIFSQSVVYRPVELSMPIQST